MKARKVYDRFGPHFDVMLYVRDIVRSVTFYQTVLGFEFEGWWSDEHQKHLQGINGWKSAGKPGYVTLQAGPLNLSLHACDKRVNPNSVIFHLEVNDINEMYKRFVKRGLNVKPPEDEPWGWRMVFIADPDGHKWGLYSDSKC